MQVSCFVIIILYYKLDVYFFVDDKTSVRLAKKNSEGTDYINANFVDVSSTNIIDIFIGYNLIFVIDKHFYSYYF